MGKKQMIQGRCGYQKKWKKKKQKVSKIRDVDDNVRDGIRESKSRGRDRTEKKAKIKMKKKDRKQIYKCKKWKRKNKK